MNADCRIVASGATLVMVSASACGANPTSGQAATFGEASSAVPKQTLTDLVTVGGRGRPHDCAVGGGTSDAGGGGCQQHRGWLLHGPSDRRPACRAAYGSNRGYSYVATLMRDEPANPSPLRSALLAMGRTLPKLGQGLAAVAPDARATRYRSLRPFARYERVLRDIGSDRHVQRSCA